MNHLAVSALNSTRGNGGRDQSSRILEFKDTLRTPWCLNNNESYFPKCLFRTVPRRCFVKVIKLVRYSSSTGSSIACPTSCRAPLERAGRCNRNPGQRVDHFPVGTAQVRFERFPQRAGHAITGHAITLTHINHVSRFLPAS